jgi:hypothetical protein
MNATTYSGWKANQVRVLERATCDQRDRYLRGIALVWGEVVSADIESAFKAKGGDLYAEESTDEARQEWQRAQARLLTAKKERAARTRHPLNAGSRGMAKDPAAVLEERESRLCKGCLYEYRVTIVGDIEYGCSRGFSHGVRCRGYWARDAR